MPGYPAGADPQHAAMAAYQQQQQAYAAMYAQQAAIAAQQQAYAAAYGQFPGYGQHPQQAAAYGAFMQPQAAAAGPPPGMYVGSVKNYEDEKGFGFIECDVTRQKFGKDVFLLKSLLNGIALKTGDKVQFGVEDTDKGPRATDVTVVQGDAGQAYGQQHGGGQTTGMHEGTVKNFNADKGFGFIDCEATRASSGKDVLLLRSQLNGTDVNVGDRVSFRVEDNGGKGLKAAEVSVLVRSSAEAGANPVEGKRYVGTVKTYDEGKGYGFIVCEETRGIYQKDMFVLRSQLKDQHANPGDRVEFSVSLGSKGPMAIDCTPAADDGGNQTDGGGYGAARPSNDDRESMWRASPY